MDQVIQNELDTITGIIVNTLTVEQIYLFGSFAYGTATENSDFDLFVVIPDGSMRPLTAMQEIGYAIFGLTRRPVDVLVGTRSSFDTRKQQPTLERTIDKKGVLLYGGPQRTKVMA
ncbi:MAG: nucleotidyltransferase domain-containing protein [Pseudoflavonifractor sp.]